MRRFILIVAIGGVFWAADAQLFHGRYLKALSREAEDLNRSLQLQIDDLLAKFDAHG